MGIWVPLHKRFEVCFAVEMESAGLNIWVDNRATSW